MKRILVYILFSLILAQPVVAGNFYASSTGTDTEATGGCDDSGDPCSLSEGISAANNSADGTDTLYLMGTTGSPDTHTITSQISLSAGVSLTSNAQNYSAVKIQPGTDFAVGTAMIELSSVTPGSTGNQSISYIELDGINGGHEAQQGIYIKNRDDVRIHHCYLHDFRGDELPNSYCDGVDDPFDCCTGDGTGTCVGERYSAAIIAESTAEDRRTVDWDSTWPDDCGEDGDDSSLTSWWDTSGPIDSLEIDNNLILDSCLTWADPLPDNGSGAICLWHIANSSIHNNTIRNDNHPGECITGYGNKEGLFNNVDIYSNILDTGVKRSGGASWAIESWVWRNGCEIYDNDVFGSFSITIGKNTTVRDNTLTISPVETTDGIGIEAIGHSYYVLRNNFIENMKQGINIGTGPGQNSGYTFDTMTVENNFISNVAFYGFWIQCLAPGDNDISDTKTVSNLTVKDNIVVNKTSGNGRGRAGAILNENSDDHTGNCSFSNITIGATGEGNIFTGQEAVNWGYGGRSILDNAITNLSIDDNNYYSNTHDEWSGSAETNPDTTNPTSETYGTQAYYDELYNTWYDAIHNKIRDASPADDATGVSETADLNWTNPTGYTSVDVYFEACDGDLGTLVVDDGDVATYDPGTMDNSEEYCWRVDVNHAGGTETGTEYSFTTAAGPPAQSANLSSSKRDSGGTNVKRSSSGADVKRQ